MAYTKGQRIPIKNEAGKVLGYQEISSIDESGVPGYQVINTGSAVDTTGQNVLGSMQGQSKVYNTKTGQFVDFTGRDVTGDISKAPAGTQSIQILKENPQIQGQKAYQYEPKDLPIIPTSTEPGKATFAGEQYLRGGQAPQYEITPQGPKLIEPKVLQPLQGTNLSPEFAVAEAAQQQLVPKGATPPGGFNTPGEVGGLPATPPSGFQPTTPQNQGSTGNIDPNTGQPYQISPDYTASPATPSFQSTGIPQMDELLAEMKKYLDKLNAAGQKINPDMTITPALAQQFLDQAETELNPQYAEQLKVIKSDLTQNLGDLQKQYDINQEDTQSKLKQALLGSRESAAGAGTTFSGGQRKAESMAIQSQQRSLDLGALQFGQNLSSQLGKAEQAIGSSALNTLNIPKLPTYQVGAEGEFNPAGSQAGYTPYGGLTGTIENARRYATEARKKQLEQSELQKRVLNFYPQA